MLDVADGIDRVDLSILQLVLLFLVLLVSDGIRFDDATILPNSIGRLVVHDVARRVALVNPLFLRMDDYGKQLKNADGDEFHLMDSMNLGFGLGQVKAVINSATLVSYTFFTISAAWHQCLVPFRDTASGKKYVMLKADIDDCYRPILENSLISR
jgi:hypothetical protein